MRIKSMYSARNERPPGLHWPGGCCRAIWLAAVLCSASTSSAARLSSADLLLIYNRNEPASLELARHYAQARGVAADRLFGVDVPANREDISRKDFEQRVIAPIRAHLEEQELKDRVRCLVTFYGLPIHVGPLLPTEIQKSLADQWHKQLETSLDEFDRTIDELDSISGGPATRPHPRVPKVDDYLTIMNRYARLRIAAFQHVATTQQGGIDGKNLQRFATVIEKLEGLAGLVEVLHPANDNEAAKQRMQEARAAIRGSMAKVTELLSRGPDDPAREEARRLIRQVYGLRGLLVHLFNDLSYCRTDETNAAFDSELTLLWWSDYPKFRWVLNPLCWRMRNDPSLYQLLPFSTWNSPVLMVSRIDGSTPKVARRMIDDAVAAEKTGLDGTIYLDAQGLKAGEGKGQYDQNLRDLASLIWRDTALTARLDNQVAVYGPGKCPRTMLYCGWYSLRKYVPAFRFVPGAVGYHIASFEALSLKNPDEKGWCKNLLDAGIAATMGPVGEPYLQSFPLPREFFGLLLTGQFSLVECYAYTAPFNSWMLMLLGDPLYCPFTRHPQMKVETVFPLEQIPQEFKPASATRPTSSSAAAP